MKTGYKNETADAKGCIITGAMDGSTKWEPGTCQKRVQGPTGTIENIVEKRVTVTRKGISEEIFPCLGKRKKRE